MEQTEFHPGRREGREDMIQLFTGMFGGDRGANTAGVFRDGRRADGRSIHSEFEEAFGKRVGLVSGPDYHGDDRADRRCQLEFYSSESFYKVSLIAP